MNVTEMLIDFFPLFPFCAILCVTLSLSRGVTSTNNNKSTAGCRQAASGINRQRRDELLQEKARLEQEHSRIVQMRAQVDGAIKDTLTNENTARYVFAHIVILGALMAAYASWSWFTQTERHLDD